MSNVEFQAVLHALDAARAKFGMELFNTDTAAERIRLLVNLTVQASESAVFGAALSLVKSEPRSGDAAGETEPQ